MWPAGHNPIKSINLIQIVKQNEQNKIGVFQGCSRVKIRREKKKTTAGRKIDIAMR